MDLTASRFGFAFRLGFGGGDVQLGVVHQRLVAVEFDLEVAVEFLMSDFLVVPVSPVFAEPAALAGATFLPAAFLAGAPSLPALAIRVVPLGSGTAMTA